MNSGCGTGPEQWCLRDVIDLEALISPSRMSKKRKYIDSQSPQTMVLRYDTYALKARSYGEDFFRPEGQEEGS